MGNAVGVRGAALALVLLAGVTTGCGGDGAELTAAARGEPTTTTTTTAEPEAEGSDEVAPADAEPGEGPRDEDSPAPEDRRREAERDDAPPATTPPSTAPPAAPPTTDPPPGETTGSLEPLEVIVRVEGTGFARGYEVGIVIEACNRSEAEHIEWFEWGPWGGIDVRDADGELVADNHRGVVRPAVWAPQRETWVPGQCRTQRSTWDQHRGPFPPESSEQPRGDRAEPGRYWVEYHWSGMGDGRDDADPSAKREAVRHSGWFELI